LVILFVNNAAKIAKGQKFTPLVFNQIITKKTGTPNGMPVNQ